MTNPASAIKRKELTPYNSPTDHNLFDIPKTWEDAPPQAYAAWLGSQPLRPSTKTVYLAMFSRFCQWLTESGKSLLQCEAADIALFLDTPNPNTGRTPQAQTGRQHQQYVRQLERVFDHLPVLGREGSNPGREAAIARIGAGEDKPTRFLSRAEREAVINALATQLARLQAEGVTVGAWLAYRDLTLVAVLLGAGLKATDP